MATPGTLVASFIGGTHRSRPWSPPSCSCKRSTRSTVAAVPLSQKIVHETYVTERCNATVFGMVGSLQHATLALGFTGTPAHVEQEMSNGSPGSTEEDGTGHQVSTAEDSAVRMIGQRDRHNAPANALPAGRCHDHQCTLLVQHTIADSHVGRWIQFGSHGHCLHRATDSDTVTRDSDTVTSLLGSNLHPCDYL